MTKDEFIDEKSAEWFDNQDGCNCPAGNPPCSWCTSEYSLPLAEYLDLELEYEYGPNHAEQKDPHEDYDRAMRDLF